MKCIVLFSLKNEKKKKKIRMLSVAVSLGALWVKIDPILACFVPKILKRNYCTAAVLTLVLLNPDITCLCKQCRSRSVGF